jgi:peptide methionine sulfoxide reductase MsrB
LLYSVSKSDEEWRVQLSPEQFRILRKKGTEMAGTGEYDKHVRRHPFVCIIRTSLTC